MDAGAQMLLHDARSLCVSSPPVPIVAAAAIDSPVVTIDELNKSFEHAISLGEKYLSCKCAILPNQP